jgi:hypothetical protein
MVLFRSRRHCCIVTSHSHDTCLSVLTSLAAIHYATLHSASLRFAPPHSASLRVESVRTVAIDMWTLFIPPALSSSPSALSHLPPGARQNTSSTEPPQFAQTEFDAWIAFQKQKNRAVSKDTWSLFVDFIRSIDKEFKEYDEGGECNACL